MKKLAHKKPSLHLIYTTSSIVDYLDWVFSKYAEITHIVDDSLIWLIRSWNKKLAQSSARKIIDKLQWIDSTIIITCTALGEVIWEDYKYNNVTRIEIPSIEEIKTRKGLVWLVFTNTPVFEEIRHLLIKNWVNDERLLPCYIPWAFDAILNKDYNLHDSLIIDKLESNPWWVDNYFLCQVSICSANSRNISFDSITVPIISMTDIILKDFLKRTDI